MTTRPRRATSRALGVRPVHCGFVAEDTPGKPTTPRSIRIEDDLWTALEPAARTAHGMDRSGLIRQFVRWYLHIPGAQLPRRPDDE